MPEQIIDPAIWKHPRFIAALVWQIERIPCARCGAGIGPGPIRISNYRHYHPACAPAEMAPHLKRRYDEAMTILDARE